MYPQASQPGPHRCPCPMEQSLLLVPVGLGWSGLRATALHKCVLLAPPL